MGLIEKNDNGSWKLKGVGWSQIKPRKATDRGGYYCMPLYTNIQHGKPGWRITQCPECGAKCWRIPLAEIAEEQGARGLCTMCALKKGVGA